MAIQKQRLLASTKLSAFKIKSIVRHYAAGLSAFEAAQRMRVSYQTVRSIYDLIHKRMFDLGIYPSMDRFVGDEHWPDQEFFGFWIREMKSRKRARGPNTHFHNAEVIYRYLHRDSLQANGGGAHYVEILELVRLSGPLNRPLTEAGRSNAAPFLAGRIWQPPPSSKRPPVNDETPD